MNIDEMTVGQVKQLRSLFGVGRARGKRVPARGRAVVVIDRGWIFAGDLGETADGYIRLTNAVHVFRWESIGFAAMLAEWKGTKVDLRRVTDVEFPADSVIFRMPVPAGWGLK